jgi:lipopolysaccharide assembly protein A
MTRPEPTRERPHPDGPAAVGGPRQLPAGHAAERTRAGAAWLAAASSAVVLVFLLIFILENSRKVQIGYLGAHGQLPLGVALLFAAILGMLLVAIPATVRIIQLRLLARRHHAAGARRARDMFRSARTSTAAPTGTGDG